MQQSGLPAQRRLGFSDPGPRVIFTAGVPFDVGGTPNFMKVEVV
jgi:hypothetical protein